MAWTQPAELTAAGFTIVEVNDERDTAAQQAMALIAEAFPPHERQPLDQLSMELAEKRLELLTSYDFHLYAAVSDAGQVLAVSAGVYLGGVNAGLITYLAVRPEHRTQRLGRHMRIRLIEGFREDARLLEWPELAWVVGEVRLDNPWLQRLVRERGAIPFDLSYYHPGMDPGTATDRWVLYRQPIGDSRVELAPKEVRQLLYAIWRRAYRIRWPLQEDGFRVMLAEIEGRRTIGALPGFGFE